MDILQPTIFVVGRRRYRINNQYGSANKEESYNIEPYVEETSDMYVDKNYEDEPCDLVTCKMNEETLETNENDDFKGIVKSGENYKLTMLVHESYFGFLIGR